MASVKGEGGREGGIEDGVVHEGLATVGLLVEGVGFDEGYGARGEIEGVDEEVGVAFEEGEDGIAYPAAELDEDAVVGGGGVELIFGVFVVVVVFVGFSFWIFFLGVVRGVVRGRAGRRGGWTW